MCLKLVLTESADYDPEDLENHNGPKEGESDEEDKAREHYVSVA